MQYYLMNKDKRIAVIDCVENNLSVVGVISNEDWARINNIVGVSILEWLMNRTGFVGRKNIEILQKYIGIHNRDSLLTIEKGISINDTLWFNRVDKPVKWDDVSPYRNAFSRAISRMALDCEYTKGDLRSPSPEFNIDGSFEKCCQRRNGKIILIKSAGERYSSITGNESASEIIYNQICEFLDIDKRYYTKYSLNEKDSKEGNKIAYSQCKIFTNERYGLLRFGDSKFCNLNIKEAIELFDRTKDAKMFRTMLLLDCITFNIDRHKNNYGFIIDNDTFNIIGMAPIYDNNLCALTNISFKQSKEDISRAISKVYSTGTGMKFLELSHIAMFKEMYDIIKERAGQFKLDTSRLGSINLYDEYRSKWLERIINTQMKRIIQVNTRKI